MSIVAYHDRSCDCHDGAFEIWLGVLVWAIERSGTDQLQVSRSKWEFEAVTGGYHMMLLDRWFEPSERQALVDCCEAAIAWLERSGEELSHQWVEEENVPILPEGDVPVRPILEVGQAFLYLVSDGKRGARRADSLFVSWGRSDGAAP